MKELGRGYRIGEPRLNVHRALMSVTPPCEGAELALRHILNVAIDFPERHDKVELPQYLLPLFAAEQRRSLEIAAELENELGGSAGAYLPPLEAEENSDETNRNYGMARPFFEFKQILERLYTTDQKALRQEIATWSDKGLLFSRLHVWTAGKEEWLAPREAAYVLISISDDAFWDEHGQRDLLVALARRWQTFPIGLRRRLEKRLLKSPSRYQAAETKERYRGAPCSRNAESSYLAFQQWLSI